MDDWSDDSRLRLSVYDRFCRVVDRPASRVTIAHIHFVGGGCANCDGLPLAVQSLSACEFFSAGDTVFCWFDSSRGWSDNSSYLAVSH